MGTSTAVPQSPTITASGSSDKESKVDLPALSSDGQSLSLIGDGIVSYRPPPTSPSLTPIAWCANMDIITLHPDTC
jgi:hypothetical protein